MKLYTNSLFGLILLFFTSQIAAVAQTTQICLGQDINVCPNQPVSINICNAGLDSNTQINLDAPVVIPTLSDDVWSGVHPIGFTFNFYGNDFTHFIIGSNGLISFNISQANQYCPYVLTGVGPFPSTGGGAAQAARNAIMGAYTDINPSAPGNVGNIQYQTIGQAPNRMLVVLFRELGAFQCNQNVCHNLSIILYETSNVIEVHIGSKPICGTWNGGLAVQGLQNSDGTVGHITPGRNNQQWTAYEDGRRFTPAAPNNTMDYVITEVPYLHVTGVGSTIVWANTLNNSTFPYNNGVLNVNAPASGSIGYYLSGTSCGLPIGALSDTTFLTVNSANVTFDITNDACFQGIGSIVANASGNTPPFQFSWNTGATGNVLENLSSGTYTLTLTDSIGCVTQHTAQVNDLANLEVSIVAINNTSCEGFLDGSVEFLISGGGAPYTISANNVNFGSGPIVSGLGAGNYNFEISDNFGCSVSISATVGEPTQIPTTLSYPTSPICPYENANPLITGVQGGTFSATPNGLTIVPSGGMAGVVTGATSTPGTYTVTYAYTDSIGCAYETQSTITIHPQPNISAGSDLIICDGDSYIFNASGGVSYEWQGGFTNGSSIVPPIGTNTYTVTGTDANGCQATSSVNVTVSPYPVVSFTADPTEGYPTLNVNFTNTSTAGATDFVWNFGGYIFPSNSTIVTYPFDTPGTYTITLTGNLNGCESTGTGEVTVWPFDPPDILAPNVFSPNADGNNDTWQFVTLTNTREIDLTIINRWGNVVFESKDLDASWNGKLQNGSDAPEGVYFYKYIVLGWNGQTYEGHGNITLVRE
jgi:gliding motility-associated-like protein